MWSDRLRPVWDPNGDDPKPFVAHRKMWEWLFICHVLAERSLLEPGRRGPGLRVGREPLVALFAQLGCEVMATDLDPARAEAQGWADGLQYAGALAALNEHGLCNPTAFAQRVTYRHVDMNASGRLGGVRLHVVVVRVRAPRIARGRRTVRRASDALPAAGGSAVHTTEFNLSSDEQTVESGGTGRSSGVGTSRRCSTAFETPAIGSRAISLRARAQPTGTYMSRHSARPICAPCSAST